MFCVLFTSYYIRPVHQINWQKSRYVYDMYYTYEKISREVYDYCITNKLVDAGLIAKWKKTGYERLCSTYTINPRNYKFGTVSICRVPKQYLAPGMEIEDPITGCRGCASGIGGCANIFGNKYGQYLAAIQIAREQRLHGALNDDDDDDDEEEDVEQDTRKPAAATASKSKSHAGGKVNDKNVSSTYTGPVGAADGSSGEIAQSIWAADDEHVELSEDLFGTLDVDAEKEGKAAAKFARSNGGGGGGGGGSKSSNNQFDASVYAPKRSRNE